MFQSTFRGLRQTGDEVSEAAQESEIADGAVA